ncbi:ste ste11 protein kinase [Moniliophthora roreri MCA 2997]|uniref:Ste ste11 protein kinase n=1 Tax=Moniliophthora roreri (strain MCA 2997) TaxID=1381753 RepID=V2Z207_MONRO|nr:ste ste11 protein kinase [Moniliophthora roreri MCA 2997]
MSEARRKLPSSRRPLHVTNPGSDSDGSDGSGPPSSTLNGYGSSSSYYSWLNSITTTPSQLSLSPASSNSTSADNESTPPPPTPHDSTPTYSIYDQSRPNALPIPPTGPLNITQKQRPQLPKRPNTSPTAESTHPHPLPPAPSTTPSPPAAATIPITEKTLILVTSDSSLYANVEITGAQNAAFIRERIFTALNIFDDEDQSRFSIYQTEIGGFAMGEALSDDRLFEICRKFGDSKGSLKLLVSHTFANVHENAYRPPPQNIPIGNSITPPVLPPPPPPPPSHQYPSYPPLQPKRRQSLSRRGSVSSRSATSERGGADGGYDADSERRDRDKDRETIRAPPHHFNCVGAPGSSAPPPSSPLATRRPSQPQLATFDDNSITPPASRSVGHFRSGSDAAVEREKQHQEDTFSPSQSSSSIFRPRVLAQSKSRPDLQRAPQRNKSDNSNPEERESWVLLSKDDASSPQTPESSKRSPATKARHQLSSPSRYKSPYSSSRPLNIPPPPKMSAPVPGPSTGDRERVTSPSREPGGRRVPAGWAVGWQPPSQSTRSGLGIASPSGFMRGAKSVDNLRAYAGSAGREIPATLQPGAKKQLSNTRVNGAIPPSVSSASSSSSTSTYNPSNSRESSTQRTVRPLPGPGQGHSTTSSSSSNTLMSPSDPFQRPQSALGDTTSPTRALSPTHHHLPSLPASLRSGTGVTPLPPTPQTQPPASPSSTTTSASETSPSDESHSGAGTNISTATASTLPMEEQEWFKKYFESRSTTNVNHTHTHANDTATVIAPPRPNPLPPIPGSTTPASGTVVPPPPVPSTPTTSASGTLVPGSLYGTAMSGMSRASSEDYDSDDGGGGTWIMKPRPALKVDTTGTSSALTSTANVNTNAKDVNSGSSGGGSSQPPVPIINPQLPSGNSSPPTTTPTPHRGRMRGSTFTTKQDPESGWATRPEPEDMYERLEDFFPHHDLDKPVIDAGTGSGGTSPTSAVGFGAPSVANIAVPEEKEKKVRRGKKSIRIVAEEHKKRIDRTSRIGAALSIPPATGPSTPVSAVGGRVVDVLRKRSTKLWGSKLEEVTPSQAQAPVKASPSHSYAPPPPPPSTTGRDHPESSPGGPTTFKWVRGEMIGKGSYGKVFLALNATTGEMMAVKQVELPRTPSDRNDSRQITVVQALKLEIETLKDLDHPNIVQYLGFEETPSNLSIFLEYVPGGSIGSVLLKHGKLSEVNTKSFTGQILSGLEYLHSKSILHRDLKADNILVEASGICKISDFGISKRSEDLGAGTAMQGTVFWMAPEVVNPQGTRYSVKVDIWSVGCMVLEMLAGTRPWTGDEMFAVMFKLYQEKVPPPVPEGVVLSEAGDDFRKKCFAINPDERPSAAVLRTHDWLKLPDGWQFTGFT